MLKHECALATAEPWLIKMNRVLGQAMACGSKETSEGPHVQRRAGARLAGLARARRVGFAAPRPAG